MSRTVGSVTRSSGVPDFVPEDYTQLFAHYYSYVIALVKKAGIDEGNVEDVSMTILSRFFEKDVLNDFDPDFRSAHTRAGTQAKFRTFLSGFVLIYLRHHRDLQVRQQTRFPFSTDFPVASPNGGPDVPWIEVNSPPIEEGYHDLYLNELVQNIQSHLASLPQFPCRFSALFASMLRHIEEYGSPIVSLLAQEHEVSETTIRGWVVRLRAEVRKVLDS